MITLENYTEECIVFKPIDIKELYYHKSFETYYFP